MFRPDSNSLSFDYNLGVVNTPAVVTNPTGSFSIVSSASASISTARPTLPTVAVLNNPVKPCDGMNCPTCTNNFASKLVRVTGDWAVDAGSSAIWNGAEPKGLMVFEQKLCLYTLVITGLKKNFQYKWKVTIDNAFKENYGIF